MIMPSKASKKLTATKQEIELISKGMIKAFAAEGRLLKTPAQTARTTTSNQVAEAKKAREEMAKVRLGACKARGSYIETMTLMLMMIMA